MQTHSTMSDNTVTDETLILSVSERVASIAYRYSNHEVGFEHEDLFSVGMTEAIEAMTRYLPGLGPLAQSKQVAYLVVAAKHEMIDHHRYGRGDILRRPTEMRSAPVVSLDGDDGFSLYNAVPSPDILPTAHSASRRFGLLYEVLDALPEHYREVVCMRFGLCGYGEHRPCEIAGVLKISQNAVHCRLRAALAELREHTELLGLVGTSSSDSLPIEAPGGAGGDCVPTGDASASQGDDDREELARVIADFESVPSYVETNARVFAQEV